MTEVHGIRFSTTVAAKPSDRRCCKLRDVRLTRGSLPNKRSDAPRIIRFARHERGLRAELPQLAAIRLFREELTIPARELTGRLLEQARAKSVQELLLLGTGGCLVHPLSQARIGGPMIGRLGNPGGGQID